MKAETKVYTILTDDYIVNADMIVCPPDDEGDYGKLATLKFEMDIERSQVLEILDQMGSWQRGKKLLVKLQLVSGKKEEVNYCPYCGTVDISEQETIGAVDGTISYCNECDKYFEP